MDTILGAFSFNCFQTSSGDVGQAVKDAIDAGYRHIDTAFLYKNEAEIGSAVRSKIREGVIKREDIFITTKVKFLLCVQWFTFFKREISFKFHSNAVVEYISR